ncbi:MAG TPA: AI-2E family transporter, partial [Planctomycetota bacterium]|nr:AI-2E family transporter [Planctomycetota bacterium]
MDVGSLRSRATPWFLFFSVVAALYFGRELLTTLALAAFVAFVLEPFVRALTHWRIPRVIGTTLVLGGAGLLFLAVGSLLFGQLKRFAEHLPEYVGNLRMKAETLLSTYGDSIARASSTVRALGGDLSKQDPPSAAVIGPQLAESSASFLQGLIGSIAVFVAWAAFVLLLSWLMLVRWDDLRDRGLELASRSELYVTTRAATEASRKVMRYVRKQLLVNVLHGTALWILLAWVGVPNPLVWGILAAGLRYIPYLGPAISIIAPLVVSLASSEGWSETWHAALALIGLEIVTNNVVEPLVYGSSTGISTLALLVSAAFWTWVWGTVGLVLSVPLAVCLLVIGRHFPRLRFLELLISDRPAMPESSRLYHRMLTGAQDEAWELLRGHMKPDCDPLEADGLLLNALGLAGQAMREGTIDAEERELLTTLTQTLASELCESRVVLETEPRKQRSQILCLGARDEFDAVGSQLLAAELERRGLSVRVAGERELLAETLAGMRA